MAAQHVDRDASRTHRKTHTPDAYVFANDDGHPTYLCLLCSTLEAREDLSMFGAWYKAAQHLRYIHNIRRAWIDYNNPAVRSAIQLALPVVIAHNTSRQRD